MPFPPLFIRTLAPFLLLLLLAQPSSANKACCILNTPKVAAGTQDDFFRFGRSFCSDLTGTTVDAPGTSRWFLTDGLQTFYTGVCVGAILKEFDEPRTAFWVRITCKDIWDPNVGQTGRCYDKTE